MSSRTAYNKPSKAELKIRRQVFEICKYIDDREENDSLCQQVFGEKSTLPTYLEKFSKKYPEATDRVARSRLQIKDKNINEILEEEAELGNYPMTKERILELIEEIPEELFHAGMPMRSWLRLYVNNSQQMPSELFALYLKSIKPHLTKQL